MIEQLVEREHAEKVKADLRAGLRFTTYLQFSRQPQDPAKKTETWQVRSVKHGWVLGYIRWYGGWRQYVFHPAPVSVFNRDCLGDIADVLRGLMDLRK